MQKVKKKKKKVQPCLINCLFCLKKSSQEKMKLKQLIRFLINVIDSVQGAISALCSFSVLAFIILGLYLTLIT